jgi:hypothetical protein
LFDDYTTLAGHRPDAAEQQKIIARYIDDEVLFQEALKRGIALSDKGVRQRLIERMRMDMAPEPAEPSEDELMAFMPPMPRATASNPRSASTTSISCTPRPIQLRARPAQCRRESRRRRFLDGPRLAPLWPVDDQRDVRAAVSRQARNPAARALGRTGRLDQGHAFRPRQRPSSGDPRPYPEVRDLVLHDWKTAHADQALQSQLTRLRSRYRVSVAPVSGETPRESGLSTSNTP